MSHQLRAKHYYEHYRVCPRCEDSFDARITPSGGGWYRYCEKCRAWLYPNRRIGRKRHATGEWEVRE